VVSNTSEVQFETEGLTVQWGIWGKPIPRKLVFGQKKELGFRGPRLNCH